MRIAVLCLLVIAACGCSSARTEPERRRDDDEYRSARTGRTAATQESGGKEWVDAEKGFWEEDGVRVRVLEVRVDNARGTDTRGREHEPYVSEQKMLVVRLRVENRSDGKKVDFRPFGYYAKDAEYLTDDIGNTYKGVFTLGVRIDGEAKSQSIYPGKSVDDVMIFEAPVGKATILHLKLPKEPVGAKQSPRFLIRTSMAK